MKKNLDPEFDVAGWDEGKRDDTSWLPQPRKKRTYPINRKFFFLMFLFLVAFTICIQQIFFTPKIYGHPIATNDTAAIANLKSIATAQQQYNKKYGCFAASGKQLMAAALISPDFGEGFESYLGSGDVYIGPKAGYIYRMLLGTTDDPMAYVLNPSDPLEQWKLKTWAATNKPSVPDTTGEYQYFITEAGTVYKQDNGTSTQWILGAVPPEPYTGWTPAK